VKIAVVKAGGSVLASPSDYLKLAKSLKQLAGKGYSIVLVVSAMKGFTDWLLKAGEQAASGNPDPILLDDLLSMGERLSARLMSLALKSVGLEVIVLDPLDDAWPIITDQTHGKAKPLLDDIREKVDSKFKELLVEGRVVIVPGFIGLSKESRRVTTLGRNSSDITAALLASCLGADILVYLKDTGGLLRLPPELRRNEVVGVISARALKILARHGVRVIHPEALDYLKPPLKVVLSSVEGLPELKGTEVLLSNTPSPTVSKGLNLLTFVGARNIEHLLALLISEFQREKGRVVDILTREGSLSLLIKGSIPVPLIESCIKKGLADAAHIEEGVALIRAPAELLDPKRVCDLRRRSGVYEVILLEDEIRLVVARDKVDEILENCL